MGLWDGVVELPSQVRVPRHKRQLVRPVFTRPDDWRPHEELPELHGLVVLDLENKDVGLAEGHGTSWYRHDGGFIAGVGIANDILGDPSDDFYLPLRHAEGNIDPDRVMRWLRAQVQKPDVTLVYANAPYDLGWLRSQRIEPAQLPHDVQVQAALIDEFKFNYGLDALGREYLGEGKNDKAFVEACRAGGLVDPMSHMDLVPGWLAETYCLRDLSLTRRLFTALSTEIEQQELQQVYELERECCLVALDLKTIGVAVDNGQIERVRRDFLAKRDEYLHLIKQLCGVHVHPSDPKSIIKALKADNPKIALPKTANGSESIREEVLDKLPDSPVVTAIRWARKYDRAIGTFIDAYLLGHQYHGRVHADFNPTRRSDERSASGGTTSGRFSSNNPNLQNIPIRIPAIGLPLRACFVADNGGLWAKLDYASQEPRLTIHFAHLLGLRGAAAMVQRFLDDPMTDLHLETALLMFGHTRETWEMLDRAERKRLRGRAKVINLAIAYGAGGANISRQLGLPVAQKTIIGRNLRPTTIEIAGEQAQMLLNRHMRAVPFLRKLQEIAKTRVELTGVIRTILGRVIHFQKFGDEYSRAYKALNALIQGSAADQMKRALVLLRREGVPVQLTVHDEADMTVARGADAFITKIRGIMEAAVPLALPVVAEVKLGNNWGEVSEE